MIFLLQNSALYIVKYEEDDYDRCGKYLIPPEPLDGWKGYKLLDIEIKSVTNPTNNDDQEFEVIARYLHGGKDLPGHEKKMTLHPEADLKEFSRGHPTSDRFDRRCHIFSAIISILALSLTIIFAIFGDQIREYFKTPKKFVFPWGK